ncbi:MAG: DUF4332 domain-containing protein [Desulfopila sp.]
MTRISSIEGIGTTYIDKLIDAGITTVENLLQLGSTRKGRQVLADQLGVSDSQILHWVNTADLFRVKGVGSHYAVLLENAGVDSVVELASRNPEHLLGELQQINDSRHLVRSMPYLKQVTKWVNRARALPTMVGN